MSDKKHLSDEDEIRIRVNEYRAEIHKNPISVCTGITDVLKKIEQIKKYKFYDEIKESVEVTELSAFHILGLSYYHSGNIEQTLITANELLKKADVLKHKEYEALAEHIIAKTDIKKGQWVSAKERLLKVLPILENSANHEFAQSVLIDLSNIEQDRNNYEESISLLLRAENEYQQHPTNPRISSIIKSNTSDVFFRLGNYEKALEYVTLSIDEAKKANEPQMYANALLRLSNVYSRQGETKKQIETLIESIEVLQGLQKESQIAIRRIALGSAYMNNNDFENSLWQFNEALQYLELKNDKKNIAFLHHRMGILFSHQHFEQSDRTLSENHFKKAELLAIELSMPHFQAVVMESLSDAYFSFGLFEESRKLLKDSISLEKQILNEKSFRQVHDLENKHKMIVKEKEIELLAANNKMLEFERTHLQSQLSINNQYLFMYKKELNNFKSDINYITKQLDKAENIVRKVRVKLRESASAHQTWESYLEVFSQVHPNFKTKLKELYPHLSPLEVKVCVLTRAGLKAEEIGEILSLSERTIENNRFRIRKKLGLKEKEKLDEVLCNL